MKGELSSAFKVADMRPIQFYLGLKVERDRESQTDQNFATGLYQEIVAKFQLYGAHPVKLPMKDIHLFLNEGQASKHDTKRHQR